MLFKNLFFIFVFSKLNCLVTLKLHKLSVKFCCFCCSSLRHVQLFATPWTVTNSSSEDGLKLLKAWELKLHADIPKPKRPNAQFLQGTDSRISQREIVLLLRNKRHISPTMQVLCVPTNIIKLSLPVSNFPKRFP